MEANSTSLPGMNTFMGTGIVAQLTIALIVLAALYVLFFAAEGLYRTFRRYDRAVVELMPYTYSAESKSYIVSQDPNDPMSKPIQLSDNERTGIEFSYSFFIYVNPSTFREHEGLFHVFHKGYSGQYPLLGPGVYMKSNSNTMRVYMNSTTTWNNYCDIENFPVQKWVHVALVCRANGLEVYINGDVSKRLTFSGGVPYQNYQDFYVFSQRTLQIAGDDMTGTNRNPSTGGKSHQVFGSYRGSLSRLTYFNYAMSYTEIASMMNSGPSKRMESQTQDQPPYLVDTWWTTAYSNNA